MEDCLTTEAPDCIQTERFSGLPFREAQHRPTLGAVVRYVHTVAVLVERPPVKGTSNAGLFVVRGEASAGREIRTQMRAVGVKAGDFRVFVSEQNDVVTAKNRFVDLSIVFYRRTVGDRYPGVRVDRRQI